MVAEKHESLTERELEVVRLVATGATNQQIARELVISVNTVKVHLKNIFTKLDIQSRTEVALYAVSQGWVELDRPVTSLEEVAAEVEPAIPEPVSLRKRVFFVFAALIVALVVLFPQVGGETSSPASSEFVDRGDSTNLSGPALQLYRWSSMAPLPTARSRFAIAYHDRKTYAIGGDTVDGVTGMVEEYDTSANSWRARSSKPILVNNIGAAAIGGRIYVPGGYTGAGEVITDLEIYDPGTDSWERGASLRLPLCAYAIAVVDERLYLFGGWDGSDYLASTYEYDPSADLWLEKTSMPSARGFAGAGVIEGKVYVVGGYDGREEFSTVEEYDPAMDDGTHDPWVVKSPMTMRRGGLGVAAIAGSLYAIGGGWDSYLAYNERYDVTTDKWSVIETPVFGQWRNLGVVASDTRVYAIGGWNGDYLNLNEEYQAIFTYYLPELPR
jgi:DNA-binding CsgD family transcriptional regulator